MTALEVKNVSVRYMTGDFKDIGLKEYVMRKLKNNYHVSAFWADRDVTFSLEKGDMLGIIGTNGAGKSTLLKAISGIMEPTKGSVKRVGSIAALLELTSGFDGDLTVRENTYLRGAMLGYTRQFMDDTYDKIIEFAELKDFQDRPFKQLSTGMKSRLAFSIASLVQPDILILDEVLSVGDGAFRKKSETKMREIIQGGATTILVSHSVQQVRQLCNKVLWLEKGQQIAFGNTETLCDLYQQYLDKSISLEQAKEILAAHKPKSNQEGEISATKPNKIDMSEAFMGEKTNSRVILWDNIKALLMLLVVVGHFVDSYSNNSHLFKSIFLFAYAFHMPLFLFVAGLFHKNKNINEKVLSYFSIYLVYKIAIITTRAAFGKKWSFALLSESSVPWFMFALAVFICLTYALQNVENKAFIVLLSIGLACFAGYDSSIGDYLIASRIIVFFPFYYLGTLIPREKLECMAEKSKWKLIGLFVVLLWLGACYFGIDYLYVLRHLFTGRNPFNKAVKPIGWIVRLGCYFITSVVGASFILMTPNRRIKYFTTVGEQSLQVYFWHYIIKNILLFLGCLDGLVALGTTGKILLLMVSAGVTLLCSASLFREPTSLLMKATKGKKER